MDIYTETVPVDSFNQKTNLHHKKCQLTLVTPSPVAKYNTDGDSTLGKRKKEEDTEVPSVKKAKIEEVAPLVCP